MPTGSRFDGSKFMDGIFQRYFGEKSKDSTIKVLKGLGEIAAEVGCTQAQLVLAWTIVNKDVSSWIFGATKVSQVEDNLKALEIASNWNQELEEKIETVLGNSPDMQYDFSRFTKFEPRRKERVDFKMTPEPESPFAKALFDHFSKSKPE